MFLEAERMTPFHERHKWLSENGNQAQIPPEDGVQWVLGMVKGKRSGIPVVGETSCLFPDY